VGFLDTLADGGRYVGGKLFGTGKDPGFFGTGQYQADPYDVNRGAARIPEAERMRQTFQQGAVNSGDRGAATTTGATIATGPQDEFRAAQGGLVSSLARQASGQGPTVAGAQLQRAADRSAQNALAIAAGVRGPGSAGALREVQNQRSEIMQGAAADSAALALQEQQSAANLLGQVAGGARGQDIALASEQAGLSQQANLANLQSEQAQRALNDQAVQYYLSQGYSLALAQQQAAMDLEKLLTDQNIQINAIQAGAYDSAAGRRVGFVKDLARAGAQAAGTGAAGPAAGGGG
jgi:hypothetical protein